MPAAYEIAWNGAGITRERHVGFGCRHHRREDHLLIPLGVAHLTALELPPPDLARQAGRAGFQAVGFRLHPPMTGGVAYPSRPGTRAHQELRNVLAGEGMALNEVEFIQLTPDVDVASFAGLLEAGADLGAACVTVSGDDADWARLIANFAALCDLAASFGLRVDLEFMRWRVVGSLEQAASVIARADRPNGAVLLDALHLSRSGGAPAQLQDLPLGIIHAAQLCDARASQPRTNAEVIAEAREGRLPPGEGELPLAELLCALPTDTVLSVEMPLPSMIVIPRLALAHSATCCVLAAARGSA